MTDPLTPQNRNPPTIEAPRSSPEATRVSSAMLDQSHTPGPNRYTGLELWLHRITVLTFVFVCAVVGVLLVIVPWTPQWTDNRLLMLYPDWRPVLGHGFIRGLCSGLGVLDIWIGFWEAVHYHEERHP